MCEICWSAELEPDAFASDSVQLVEQDNALFGTGRLPPSVTGCDDAFERGIDLQG